MVDYGWDCRSVPDPAGAVGARGGAGAERAGAPRPPPRRISRHAPSLSGPPAFQWAPLQCAAPGREMRRGRLPQGAGAQPPSAARPHRPSRTAHGFTPAPKQDRCLCLPTCPSFLDAKLHGLFGSDRPQREIYAHRWPLRTAERCYGTNRVYPVAGDGPRLPRVQRSFLIRLPEVY
jgi:hypothetical protein